MPTDNRTKTDRSEYYRKRNALRTPEYLVWGSMIQRCCCVTHKGYSDYGGRGITVCDAWRAFQSFFADMGERPSAKHSIERIDNNGNYEPGNCKWATATTQQRNRRNNTILTVNGVSLTQAEWAEKTGISFQVIHGRITKHGWSVEDAVLTPVDDRYRHNVKDKSKAAPKGKMPPRSIYPQ